MNPDPLIIPTGMFRSIGDFLTFIGLIVSIGAIGVYAIYKLIKEIFYGD